MHPRSKRLRSAFSLFLGSLALLVGLATRAPAADAGWKAGTATTDITPAPGQWMSGFGNRTRPADGTLHPIFIKVVALEDAAGHRAIIMSSDLLGIPQSIYNNTCAALKQQFRLEPDQIMLNASHSHCTPVLRNALLDAYPIPDAQRQSQLDIINRYSTELEGKIVDTVGRALAALAPARLSSGEGITRFAVNRRHNLESAVSKIRDNNALKGPVDFAVPVLSVTDLNGQLKAVVFGYACHNTSLSIYQWAGDYAGFAQMALEASHPGAVAMFYMGCGADQNALPRPGINVSERYGQMLASAVEEVLLQNPTPLAPTLATAHAFTTLPFGDELTVDELEKLAADPRGSSHRWAARLLAEAKAGKKFDRSYPYPLQAWLLGGRQLWITMGGEVVVDYSLRFKREFGVNTWVGAYCNDVMAYIPSARILKEDKPPRLPLPRSGYEGNTAMYVYGLPTHRWADPVEDLIAASVKQLVARVRTEAAR